MSDAVSLSNMPIQSTRQARVQQDASPPAPDGGPPSRGAIAWFVRNRVAANLLLFAISLAGLLTIRGVPQELVPETSPSTLTVSTVWPGSGASVIEDSVLVPMEEALRDIGGIREISGTARDGIGTLTVELEYWADFQGVSDEVRERVEAITSLPDGAEDPVISRSSTRRPLLRVAVHGPADERALTEAAHRVREDLSRVPGVAAVETASGRDYEIAIEVSEDVLSRFGLTFDQVAAAIRRASADIPAGSLIPMAVSLSFGVLFATLVTLLLVPAVYRLTAGTGSGRHPEPPAA